MNPPRLVRFGSFEFDPASGELRAHGRRIPLQSQPAQVLTQLVNHPGRIVTREELRRTIWGDDTFVDFDAAINVAVNKIRQALHDSATAPRFVETLPKRGYRFLADVHVAEPATAPGASATPPPAGAPARVVLSLITGLLLAVGIFGVWSGSGRDASPRERSLAVLPFRPLVAESRDDALQVGLAEAVIVRLGQLKQLRVPSINAVQRYASLDLDPRAAGRELGVEAVLDGSILRLDGNVRLSARLLDVATGTTLWARQWDLPWTDIFTVQDAMATEMARALALTLVPGELAAQEAPDQRGGLRQLPARTVPAAPADSRRQRPGRGTAGSGDPARPRVCRGTRRARLAYISIPLLEGPTVPFVELGRQAAQRALELDPTIAEAHAVLGRILVHFDWDMEAAEREMRRALELDPTDPFVLHCYARVLADDGRFEEALALTDTALAQDPTSVLANRDKAIILFLAGRYEACVEQCLRTLELDPYSAFVHSYLGRAYERLGQPEQAVEAYVTPLTFSEANRHRAEALRTAARRGGLAGFWELQLQMLLAEPEVRPFSVARAYARIGDHDRAIAWLERLYTERGAWVRGLKVQPEFDPLRTAPASRTCCAARA